MKIPIASIMLVCVVLLSACTSEQQADSLPVGFLAADSMVADWVSSGRIAGAVLMVSQDGVPVGQTSHGWAQFRDYGAGQYPGAEESGLTALSDPVPMTVDMTFDLASVTKVMGTTFAIMRLVEDGALDLDEPIQSYLPDFVGTGKDSITARHLLTHRSGLFQWKPIYYHASDREEAYEYIRALPLAWGVGEGRHYSDLGFMLLGRIVEVTTGRSLGEYLEEVLYGPLGLESTGFTPPNAGTGFAATSHGNPFERRMVHDDDFGYRIDDDPESWDGWRRYTLLGEVNDGNAHHAFQGVAGHAGLFATAADLTRLLGLLLAEGQRPGLSFVGPDIVDTFLTSSGEGQALGWQLPDFVPPRAFAHTGFTGTFVMGDRDSGLGIVLLTNRQHGGVDADTQYPDVGPLQRAVVQALTGHDAAGG